MRWRVRMAKRILTDDIPQVGHNAYERAKGDNGALGGPESTDRSQGAVTCAGEVARVLKALRPPGQPGDRRWLRPEFVCEPRAWAAGERSGCEQEKWAPGGARIGTN